MANKRVVWICSGSRSEQGLLEPIIRRCEASLGLEVKEISVNPHAGLGYISNHFLGQIHQLGTPDAVLIPTDRREMVPVAMESFYNNIPTFHFLGGTYSFSHTHDDVARHVISLFSHIMYVEDERARDLLIKSGEEPWRIVVTGSTHLDDLEIDESLCPTRVWEKDYDLVLLNPEADAQSNEKVVERLLEIYLHSGRYWVLIRPNEDPLSGQLMHEIDMKIRSKYPVAAYDTVSRPKFLGLLKNCKRFLSNSSSTLYEAPYFNVEVVNVSQRNSERTVPNPKCLAGGADRIVKHLETVDLQDPRLLWKRVRSPTWQKSTVQQS